MPNIHTFLLVFDLSGNYVGTQQSIDLLCPNGVTPRKITTGIYLMVDGQPTVEVQDQGPNTKIFIKIWNCDNSAFELVDATYTEVINLLEYPCPACNPPQEVDPIWQRPIEWLSIPNYIENEEVFYGLYAVWNTSFNPCALLCNGTGAGYTVDWGDGTVTDYAFNVKAERNYNYTGLSGTPFRGYRQALVKVTPRAGAVITNFDLQQKYTGISLQYSTGWLEKHVNFGSLTAMANAWSQIVKMSSVENFVVKKHPNIGYGMFWKYNSLRRFKQILPHIGATDNMSYNGPLGLTEVDFTVISSSPQNNNGYTFFPYARSLKSLTMTGGNSLKFQSAFNCIEYPDPANINMGGDCSFMFQNNYCLREIPAYNFSNVTNLSNWLINCDYQITRSRAFGAKITHTYATQQLSADALNEMFTNLGTANAGATITITGNPGAATCNKAIATAKGWTVIN